MNLFIAADDFLANFEMDNSQKIHYTTVFEDRKSKSRHKEFSLEYI